MAIRHAHQGLGVNSLATFNTTSLTLQLNSQGISTSPQTSSQIKTDDYVLAFLTYNSGSATAPTATLDGVAMTRLASQAFATNRYQAVFGGFVTHTSSAGYVEFTMPSTVAVSIAAIRVFSGVDTTTPTDVTIVSSTTAVSTSHSVGPITPATNGAMVVGFLAADNDNGGGSNTFITSVSDWTALDAYGTSSGSDGSLAVWSRELATPSAVTLSTTSNAVVNSGGYLVALRPSSTIDQIAEIFVGRSMTARGPNSSGGFTAAPSTPDTAARRLTPVNNTDVCIIVFVTNDSSATTFALSAPSGWTTIRETVSSGVSVQVYSKPWTSGMSLPSITTTQTIDRFWTFALLLRDVDPNDPFDVDSLTIGGGGSSTSTFPDATPTKDDAIVLRMAFNFNDLEYPTSQGDDGSKILVAPYADGWWTTFGLDQGTLIMARVLSGGAGVPLGTEGVTWSASLAGVQTYTLVLNRAPVIKQIVSNVTLGSAEVTTDVISIQTATFVESDVIIGSAVVTTDIKSSAKKARRRNRPLIWVQDYAGNQVNVID